MSERDRRHPLVELDEATLRQMLLPVAAPDDIASVELVTRGLSSTNYCVRLRTGPPLQLRVPPGGAISCAREAALLKLVSATTPVPGVQHAAPDHRVPYYVAQWIEATPLDVLLRSAAIEDERGLGAAIGQTLAGIHRHTFDREGAFDGALRVVPWDQVMNDAGDSGPSAEGALQAVPNSDGSSYARFMHRGIFRSRALGRLGMERALRLWQRVRADDATIDWSVRRCCLVHFDYNPKNILVRRATDGWSVAAVLDWEFAAAADPLLDVGNLLRHREDYPAHFVQGFIDAYADAASRLAPDWIARARLLDLSSPIESLGSQHDRPDTHALALRLVDAFLQQ